MMNGSVNRLHALLVLKLEMDVHFMYIGHGVQTDLMGIISSVSTASRGAM